MVLAKYADPATSSTTAEVTLKQKTHHGDDDREPDVRQERGQG